ncbi:MAG: TIGR03668 family PPOX class F420-dependent oxidoreductase [Deltaproteobacteria bacterium]|nr:TIGR03668 family PPOX class F420-dependent oxidoreductase [Deltaproteobacteria bacterium]
MTAGLDRAARAFLARHRVARLATADAGGAPHVVPCCYAVSGRHVYFVIDDKPKTRRGGALKRMRNIAENPSVAFVVDDWSEDWSALSFLLIRGRAAIVRGASERGRALRALRARYPQYRVMRLDGGDHPVVRIAPHTAHLWIASPPRRAAPAPRRGAVFPRHRAAATPRGGAARSPRPGATARPRTPRRRRSLRRRR